MNHKKRSFTSDSETDWSKRQRSDPSTPTELSGTGSALSCQPSQTWPPNTTDTIDDNPRLGWLTPATPISAPPQQPLGTQIHHDAAIEGVTSHTLADLRQRNKEMESIIQGSGGRAASQVYHELQAVCKGLPKEVTDPSSDLLQPQTQFGSSSGGEVLSVKGQISGKLANWGRKASKELPADSVTDEDTVMTGVDS